jgi:hypothetical protein
LSSIQRPSDERGSEDAGDGDHDQAGMHPAADVRDGERDRRERCERRAVEEPEQEEGERNGAEARAPAPAPPDDGDAEHLVAASRQRDAADRRRPARRREREHGRALLLPEQPLPPPRLEHVRGKHHDAREADEPEVRMVQRPAGAPEVAGDEHRHAAGDEDEEDVEQALQRRHDCRVIGRCAPTL